MKSGHLVGLSDHTLGLYKDFGHRDFWSWVDSKAAFDSGFERRCHCPERSVGYCTFCGGGWGEARRGCLAMKSDSTRCTQWVREGHPLCGFHMERAAQWFLDFLSHEEVESARSRIRMEYGDAEQVIHQAQQIISQSRQGGTRVYFYELAGQGLVKIGHSVQVKHRVAQFRTGKGCTFPEGCDPSTGRLIGDIAGDRIVEQTLHALFRPLRVVGEWFRLTPELEQEIASLIEADSAQAA